MAHSISDTSHSSWTERLAQHRSGLAAMSFAESTVVPIPLETVVAPLMVGHHRRAWVIAIAIWLGCLVGASLFYLVGYWLADPVVRPVLDWLGLSGQLNDVSDRFTGDGLFWTVFLVSLSPIPLQVATLGAGVTQANFAVFIGAIALSRGLRYFGLALLARLIGPKLTQLDIPKSRVFAVLSVGLVAIWAIAQLR